MNIAILGYGTVGSGVAEVLDVNQKIIAGHAGEPVNVKYVLDIRDFPGDPIQEKIVHDYNVILNDDDVKIVVEVMGGLNPAYTFVKQALLAGKSVATSNKELVAKHGAEFVAVARENQVNFLFEASVGGGIPIIRPLISSLTADEIEEITGILNGTTNYMLTKMSEEGADYAAVLRDAQEHGFAERNPEADVEGRDACRKIAILTSLACGHQVDFEDIYTEGITGITDVDFKYAHVLNKSIKLLATSRYENGGYCALVAPMMIGPENPLYSVRDVFNAIFVRGNMLGDTMYYGKGAGKLPTASAVVSDIIEEVRHIRSNIKIEWSAQKMALRDMKQAEWRFFVRVRDICPRGDVTAAFENAELISAPGVDGEYAFVTEKMAEADFDARVARLPGVITRIRCDH